MNNDCYITSASILTYLSLSHPPIFSSFYLTIFLLFSLLRSCWSKYLCFNKLHLIMALESWDTEWCKSTFYTTQCSLPNTYLNNALSTASRVITIVCIQLRWFICKLIKICSQQWNGGKMPIKVTIKITGHNEIRSFHCYSYMVV